MFDPTADPRAQEALSRKYSNDVIILLPIAGGEIAVFNSARELCGFVTDYSYDDMLSVIISDIWKPPTPIEPAPTPKATLDDLELL